MRALWYEHLQEMNYHLKKNGWICILGSFTDQNNTWWASDEDNDGLSNVDEYQLGTHPFLSDTDMDGLNDGNETMVTFTNPLLWDTDGDGIDDRNETEDQNTNPLLADSDFDGLSDRYELVMGLNPNSSDPTVSLSGIIFNPQHLDFPLYLKHEANITQDAAKASFTNIDEINDYNHTKPYAFNFPHLQVNQYHRITAFLDTDGNATHSKGEPMELWSGYLTQNIFSANLYLKDSPPTIGFNNNFSSEVSIPDGLGSYEFAHNVVALDVLDGEWDPANPSNLIIRFEGSLSPRLVNFNGTLSSNYLEANQTIPLGSYTLSYQAFDSSGEKSSIISQTIIVEDIYGPTITLFSPVFKHDVYEEWIEPGYNIQDNRDANDTVTVSIIGSPNINLVGTYPVTYRAVDSSGNISETTRTVNVVDSETPTINISENPLILTIGQEFLLPIYSANDNYDGDLTDDVNLSGIENIDVNAEGDYSVALEVTDKSGNQASETLVVRVSPPAFTLSGNAIDGYLVGANVIFDCDNDGISDLSIPSTTDQNGKYSLKITEEEFVRFDEK